MHSHDIVPEGLLPRVAVAELVHVTRARDADEDCDESGGERAPHYRLTDLVGRARGYHVLAGHTDRYKREHACGIRSHTVVVRVARSTNGNKLSQ